MLFAVNYMRYYLMKGKNRNMDISIVVLHYNDRNMTIRYVDNLMSLNWQNYSYHIVIVDNCSPDNSGSFLKSFFADNKRVDVILNHENLGFAKGNNEGIRFARNKWKSKMIIISNNDIRIEDINLPQKMVSLYQSRNPAVIGPDIFSLSKGIHQSPIANKPLNIEGLNLRIKKINKRLIVLKIIEILHIYELISKFKKLIKSKSGREGYKHECMQENVVLHGAFFVLCDSYFTDYPLGLYDKTFLYMEEDILAYLCNEKHLLMLYDPNLHVIHFDGVSSTNASGSKCRKYIFELEETRKSCGIMKKLVAKSRSQE